MLDVTHEITGRQMCKVQSFCLHFEIFMIQKGSIDLTIIMESNLNSHRIRSFSELHLKRSLTKSFFKSAA